MIPFSFDPNQATEPAKVARKLVNPGVYASTVTKAEMKLPNKPGGVPYLEVELRIDSLATGEATEFAGEKVIERFSINHPNAQDIARLRLANMMRTAGMNGVINDPVDLLKAKVIFTSKVTPAANNGKGGMFPAKAEVAYFGSNKKSEATTPAIVANPAEVAKLNDDKVLF